MYELTDEELLVEERYENEEEPNVKRSDRVPQPVDPNDYEYQQEAVYRINDRQQ